MAVVSNWNRGGYRETYTKEVACNELQMRIMKYRFAGWEMNNVVKLNDQLLDMGCDCL